MCYVDLVARTGMTFERAIAEAQAKNAQRKDSDFDQEDLDEAVRCGFANGAFEGLHKNVSAVTEEFYPKTGAAGSVMGAAKEQPVRLSDRLQDKVDRIGNR